MDYIKLNYKDKDYPKKLLKIPNYPKEIYITGNYDLLKKEKTVAIVGSRECTEYGRKYANYFSEELSKEGICIISGLAIGIDASAHIGAVENQGRTIAVLGGGFNNIYPKQNQWLFYKILENQGCIISEYAPDVEVDKRNFPKRNRIVSGMSDVVLVIEAEYRSGTSITVGYAKKQGRIVCCIPGNVENSCSLGTNRMIQEGAKLIIKPNEIIEMLQNEKINKQVENKTYRKIPKNYQEIYKTIESKPIHINEICRKIKKQPNEITQALIILELEELIEQLPGNRYKIKEK